MRSLPQTKSIPETVRQAAAEAGLDSVGIVDVREFPELEYLSEWLDAGHAGEMKYLESRSDDGEFKRASLKTVAPWARSVVVCAVNYNTAHAHSTEAPEESGRGWVSRYAWGNEDYHDYMLRQLRQMESILHTELGPGLQLRSYVDTGPIVERVYAKHAGIGWIGKNTCIINQRLGSWLFLGVILTSLDLAPDMPAPDRCGSCTRCIDACPTDAFLGPYRLDATRCISYLTIEHRGPVPLDLREGMGRHVFGCDICQDVCPWNRKAPVTQAAAFQPREKLVNPALEWLTGMDETGFRQTFRGSPVKRAKHSGIRRNAAIAMGNSKEKKFLPLLREMKDAADAGVAEHAAWAIEQLEKELP
jgi:epoxyqueuosine reductase